MTVVLVVQVISHIAGCVFLAENGEEARETGAFLLVDLLVAVPTHQVIQHGAQEATVAVGLTLRAAG